MLRPSIALALACAAPLAACGDPSLDDVCGDCDGIVFDDCRMAYEACEEMPDCDLTELEDGYDDQCNG